MIVCSRFDSDNNDVLIWIQHDLYWSLIPWLYEYPRRRYLAAINLIGLDTELARRIRTLDRTDHRTLQDAHDKIAAYHRYAHDHGGQMFISFEGLSYEDALRKRWTDFWYQEVQRLTEYDDFVRSVLTAVAFTNKPTGYEAEEHLLTFLDSIYGTAWDSRFSKPLKNNLSAASNPEVPEQVPPPPEFAPVHATGYESPSWVTEPITEHHDPIPELELILRLHNFVVHRSHLPRHELEALLPPWAELVEPDDSVPVMPACADNVMPQHWPSWSRLRNDLYEVLGEMATGEWGGLPLWTDTSGTIPEAKHRFSQRFRERLKEEVDMSPEEFELLKVNDPDKAILVTYRVLWSLYP